MTANNNMPPQEFKYNAADAQAADSGQRIDETGAYIGTLTKAKWHVAGTGAAGYMFDFESTAGQTAERLTIYTVNGQGKPIDMGTRKMSALLCCMGVSIIKPQRAVITESEYDETAGSFHEVQNEVYLYPDLMGKPIGLFLHAEDYTGNDGKDRRRLNHFLSFNAKNNRTAKEMFEGKAAQDAGEEAPKPTQVSELSATMQDKDSRKKGSGQQYNSGGQPMNTSLPVDGFDPAQYEEDIPYNY